MHFVELAMARSRTSPMATMHSLHNLVHIGQPPVRYGNKLRNALLMASFVFAVAGGCLGIGLVAADERRQEIESMSVSAPIYNRGNFDRIQGK